MAPTLPDAEISYCETHTKISPPQRRECTPCKSLRPSATKPSTINAAGSELAQAGRVTVDRRRADDVEQ
jgi:hypothetical protein